MHREPWNHVELTGFGMALADVVPVEPTLQRQG